MYESSSCEPCAYEDGTQVHQLDGIAAQSEKKKNSFKAARPVTEKKRFVLFIYITKLFFLHLTIVVRKSG